MKLSSAPPILKHGAPPPPECEVRVEHKITRTICGTPVQAILDQKNEGGSLILKAKLWIYPRLTVDFIIYVHLLIQLIGNLVSA